MSSAVTSPLVSASCFDHAASRSVCEAPAEAGALILQVDAFGEVRRATQKMKRVGISLEWKERHSPDSGPGLTGPKRQTLIGLVFELDHSLPYNQIEARPLSCFICGNASARARSASAG
jgi:hypothetical protein